MRSWSNIIFAAALFCVLILIIVSLISGFGVQNKQKMFRDYVEKFNKTYKDNPVEYATRYQHFLVSLEKIEKLNSESRGSDQHRARYGLTNLSDMSESEYRDIHLADEKLTKAPHLYGRTWSGFKNHASKRHSHLIRKKRLALPLQVDWRAKGAVGLVRNQGLCGACWAFSTVGTMEAMAAIKTGKFQALSVQEMIDCAGLGNKGCSGGDICLLLDWLLITKTVVEFDTQYPLRLTDGACRLNKNATGVRMSSFTCDDFVGTEDKILEAIATHGPVTVAVNALTWQNYLGGVIQYHCSGLPADLNHAVELVGYDLTTDVPYYIAKNSWGTDFGNEGYINLAIGNNICGLANEVATIDVV